MNTSRDTEQRAHVVRNGDRVNEDQSLAVVDCVRRHRPFPLGMRRGPVVHALGKHCPMLSTPTPWPLATPLPAGFLDRSSLDDPPPPFG